MDSDRNHLGTGFEVWTSQESWFWMVSSPNRNGGMIGAAATEAEAIREARASIRRMSVRRRAVATERIKRAPKQHALFEASSMPRLWENSLKKLERYLTCACAATA
jgi:hypothetical protein